MAATTQIPTPTAANAMRGALAGAPAAANTNGPVLSLKQGAVGNTITAVNMAGMAGTMGVPVIGWLIGGIAGLADKVRLPGVGNSLRGFNARAAAITIGDVLGAPFSAVEKIGKATGVGAIETAGSAPKKFVLNTATRVTTQVGQSFQAVMKTPFLARFGESHIAKLNVKTTAAHDAAMDHLGTIETAIQGKGFTDLEEKLAAARGTIIDKGGIDKLTAAEHSGIVSDLKKGLEATGEKPSLLSDVLINPIKNLFRKAPEAEQAITTASKSITGFETETKTAAHLAGKVAFRGNFAESMASLPSKIAGARLSQVTEPAMHWGIQGMVAYGGFKALHDPIKTMKAACEGMTGQQLSTRQILFSNDVPDAIKQMRNDFWKTGPLHVAINAAELVIFSRFRMSGGKMVHMMIGGSALSEMGAGALENLTLGNAFAKVQQAYQQQNGTLAVGAYVGLMLRASPELKKLGPDNPDVIAVARQYAAQHTQPSQVLADMENHAAGFKTKAAAATAATQSAAQTEEVAAGPASAKGAWQNRITAERSPVVATNTPSWENKVTTANDHGSLGRTA